jgi:hypothetical protein
MSPDRIEETAYHQHVLAQVQRAQAALDSWGAYLQERYALGTDDRVLPDGTIQRSTAVPEAVERELASLMAASAA